MFPLRFIERCGDRRMLEPLGPGQHSPYSPPSPQCAFVQQQPQVTVTPPRLPDAQVWLREGAQMEPELGRQALIPGNSLPQPSLLWYPPSLQPGCDTLGGQPSGCHAVSSVCCSTGMQELGEAQTGVHSSPHTKQIHARESKWPLTLLVRWQETRDSLSHNRDSLHPKPKTLFCSAVW